MTTTNQLGAMMLTDEQRKAIESGIAALEKAGWTFHIPTLNALLSASKPAAPLDPEQHGLPPYPKGNVVGPCVCGSWPGGECLKCSVIPAAPAQSGEPTDTELGLWQQFDGSFAGLRELFDSEKLAAMRADPAYGWDRIKSRDEQAKQEWHMASGDWKEELVALHGPRGHIVSGLTVEQARAIINAHGGCGEKAAAQSASGGDRD